MKDMIKIIEASGIKVVDGKIAKADVAKAMEVLANSEMDAAIKKLKPIAEKIGPQVDEFLSALVEEIRTLAQARDKKNNELVQRLLSLGNTMAEARDSIAYVKSGLSSPGNGNFDLPDDIDRLFY